VIETFEKGGHVPPFFVEGETTVAQCRFGIQITGLEYMPAIAHRLFAVWWQSRRHAILAIYVH